MNGWKCENCGHNHKASENLEELGFKWLDEDTCKTSCENCGTYSIQRAYTYDEKGYPVAGQFLIVRSKNKLRKGKL